MESDADKSFSQTMLQQTSQRLTGQDDAVIAQREREINDIAKGIIELSDIFRELQTMVIDQGTMLDRIDYNVERMGTEVKSAQQELKVVCLYFSPCFMHASAWSISAILTPRPPGDGLPATHGQAESHDPLGSIGVRHDCCSSCETEKA